MFSNPASYNRFVELMPRVFYGAQNEAYKMS